MAKTIYEIQHENILNKNLLHSYIYPNLEQHYYYSQNFDTKFYIDLALAGFITIWHEENNIQYLLPEIQIEYAILEFQDLHISKKVHKLLSKQNYSFFINEYFDEVIQSLSTHHKQSWIQGKYIDLLKKLRNNTYKKELFALNSFGIIDNTTNKIIAAEIGYSTYYNKVYTSLSGFRLRDKKYNNYGTLQLVKLAQYLESKNYSFWNLGHPYMDYKFKLGAKKIKRLELLQKLV
jgi:hypothetical protein